MLREVYVTKLEPYLEQVVYQPLLTARKLLSVQKHTQHARLSWKRRQPTEQHRTHLCLVCT